MLRFTSLAALALLATLASPRAEAGDGQGIRWEVDAEAAQARAAREGRPLLLALNALETERANQQLALELYRSAAWGDATEDWVCLPCNANHHGGAACSRYEGIPCSTHQTALRLLYKLRRLPADRTVISPAHVVIDPDGRLVWDKEYYTGVVGPQLFERMLVGLSPSIALDRAARIRSHVIQVLEEVPTRKLDEEAEAWLGRDDPLAAAGLIVAADQELDPQRRLTLVRSLRHAREADRPLVQVGAYEGTLFPGHDLDLCLGWLEVAFATERRTALGHAMRAAFRAEDAATRDRILAVARPKGGAKRSAAERAAKQELHWLLGQAEAGRKAVEAEGDWIRRQARAQRIGLGQGRVYAPLAEVAADAPPATLRGALLEAEPAEVRAEVEAVRQALRTRREERVRIAAALALLGAGLDDEGRVPKTILGAVFDVVEGEDTRREAVRRLGGDDPGWNEEVWIQALDAAVGGAR